VTTIETDHDFEVALLALMKKKKDNCNVSVEFDLNTMEGFRIRKRVHSYSTLAHSHANKMFSPILLLIPVDMIKMKSLCMAQRFVFLLTDCDIKSNVIFFVFRYLTSTRSPMMPSYMPLTSCCSRTSGSARSTKVNMGRMAIAMSVPWESILDSTTAS
jgi:hypothetical protein